MSDLSAKNADRELWRERPGDYYSDRLFVTEGGGIGMDCGGNVAVRPIREWFKSACVDPRTIRRSPDERMNLRSFTMGMMVGIVIFVGVFGAISVFVAGVKWQPVLISP